jgi:hypothetical protein
VKCTLASVLTQPLPFGAGDSDPEMVGASASIFTVNVGVITLPARSAVDLCNTYNPDPDNNSSAGQP